MMMKDFVRRLLIKVATLLLIFAYFALGKFEIFASGRKHKIATDSTLPQYNLAKINIDEAIKEGILTQFTSSTYHAVFGVNSNTFYGFGDNTIPRISRYLPRSFIFKPTQINDKNLDPLIPTAADAAFLLEDFTFLTNNTWITNMSTNKSSIYSAGFPDDNDDSLPFRDFPRYRILSSFEKEACSAKPITSRNTKALLFSVPPYVNETSSDVQLNADLMTERVLEYGYTLGIDGDFTIDKDKLFSMKVKGHQARKILKIQGIDTAFYLLNKFGLIYQYGMDKSRKTLGETYRLPYANIFDKNRVPQQYPSMFMSLHVIAVSYGLEGETIRFRNIFSGKTSTVAITFDKRMIVWGKNPFNMLGATNYDPNEEYVVPSRSADTSAAVGWPNLNEIKQISIGDKHTLVLKKDNTVWGIGCNIYGELAQNETITYSTKFIQIQFPDITERTCLQNGQCTIEFVHAGTEASFIGVNYNVDPQPKSIQMLPTCSGISHLDVNVCSGNGHCVSQDFCSCFLGHRGLNCELLNDCSKMNNCSGRGFCIEDNVCDCFDFATGNDCSLLQCERLLNASDAQCSGKGTCVIRKSADGKALLGAECKCDEGWSGIHCADGPNSPILYAAGSSKFGETGTGLLGIVDKFTKVRFLLSGYDKDYRLDSVQSGVYYTSLLYGSHLHSLPTPWTWMYFSSTLGSSFDGFFSVPFPYYTYKQFKDVNLDRESAAIDTDGNVYMLLQESTSGYKTKPVLFPAMKGAEKIYATAVQTFFLRGGEVFERTNDLVGYSKVPFLNPLNKGSKILECCSFVYGIMCLTGYGEVVIHKSQQYFGMTDNSLRVFEHLGTIMDIRCSPNAGAVKTKNKEWYTFGSNLYGELGRKPTGNQDILLADEFRVPGHEVLDLSLGFYHSLLLTQEVVSKKKHVFAIGSNEGNRFGFVGGPTSSQKLIEVKFDADFPIQSITRVLATPGNSFIGDWGKQETLEWCNGVPSKLTDLVCEGIGDCVQGKCICKTDGFINYNDTNPAARQIIEGIAGVYTITKYLDRIGIDLNKMYQKNQCVDKSMFDTLASIIAWTEYIAVFVAAIGMVTVLSSVCFICFNISFVGGIACFSAMCLGCISLCCCGLLRKEKRKRKKQDHALLDKLLEKDSQEMGETDSIGLDMSLFNLDFNDFKIVQEIGTGGSGALCLEALDKKADERVFIKLFVMKKKDGGDEWDVAEFKNEVQHLTRLRHTNIVTFYGLFFAPPSRVGYVCEFCQEGSLHSFLKRFKSQKENPSAKHQTKIKFDIRKKLDWLTQIAKGMRFLHQKSVIFRDLKPENVLIGKNEVLKITDFGISKTYNSDKVNSMTRQSGTSLYMAPEVVAGKQYGFEVDVFSYAILMYEVLHETVFPYGENAPFGIEFRVSQDPNLRPIVDLSFFDKSKNFEKREISDFEPAGLSGEMRIIGEMMKLMQKCWDHEPSKRPNFRDIVSYLQEFDEELEKLEEK